MTKLWNKVLSSVEEWRTEGYPEVTPTTKRLLEYWFKEDHIYEDGEPLSSGNANKKPLKQSSRRRKYPSLKRWVCIW